MPEIAEPKVAPATTQERDPAFERFMQAAQREVPKDEEPPMWAILLHNDSSTGPDFVIKVLMEAFGLEGNKARRLMMVVHLGDRGVVTVTTKERAETMMETARGMISKAEPGRDFFANVSSCQLTFTMEEEKEKSGG